MQQLLYVGGAATLQPASLFKCEVVGRFKILSVFLLNHGKRKMVSLACRSVIEYKIFFTRNEDRERGGKKWGARLGWRARETDRQTDRPWPEEKGPGRWAEGYMLGASVRQEAKGDFDKPRGGKL